MYDIDSCGALTNSSVQQGNKAIRRQLTIAFATQGDRHVCVVCTAILYEKWVFSSSQLTIVIAANSLVKGSKFGGRQRIVVAVANIVDLE